jgi:DsbC/DsbD-like thiol-disulfide interchange protein
MIPFPPIAALVSVILGAAAPESAQPAPATHAKPRLISEHAALVPGKTNWLGLTFDIDDTWHIYWDGAGDTGQPVKAVFVLPPGFKAGEIIWPTPKRYVLDGYVLDYIYENRVTLLVPLEVPADSKIGEDVKIRATVSWMECSEECRPGKAELSIQLPIASSEANASKSAEAGRFDDTRKRLPRPVEETARNVRSTWQGDRLTFAVQGASSLVFHPHRTSAPLADAMKQGEVKGDRMTLDLTPGGGSRVRGILEVIRTDAKGKKSTTPESYTIDLPRDTTGAAAPKPTTHPPDTR